MELPSLMNNPTQEIGFLDHIESPDDLKKLTFAQLIDSKNTFLIVFLMWGLQSSMLLSLLQGLREAASNRYVQSIQPFYREPMTQ